MSANPSPGAPTPTDHYPFAANVPFDPVPRGTTIVIRGDPDAAPGELAMRLLAPLSARRGGAVLIETDDMPNRVAERWTEQTDIPASRLAVVGCHEHPPRVDEGLGAAACVSQPGDLTGLGIQYSKLARSFTEGPQGRLRVGLDSISTLLVYCDDVQTVYRFIHTLTGRIRSSGQLGVFVFHPAMHDDRVSSVVTQPFDAAVDVRLTETGEREARLTGLGRTESAWHPV